MTSNIIGWVIVILISVIGWILANKATSKVATVAAEKAKEVAKETAANEIKGIQDSLKVLPCMKSNTYEKDYGALIQLVKDLDKKFDQILSNQQKNGNKD